MLQLKKDGTKHHTTHKFATLYGFRPKYQVMPGGEKGEVTMGGEMRSRYGGATLQSGGIVCPIVVKFCIQIQQLGVESLWRGYI